MRLALAGLVLFSCCASAAVPVVYDSDGAYLGRLMHADSRFTAVTSPLGYYFWIGLESGTVGGLNVVRRLVYLDPACAGARFADTSILGVVVETSEKGIVELATVRHGALSAVIPPGQVFYRNVGTCANPGPLGICTGQPIIFQCGPQVVEWQMTVHEIVPNDPAITGVQKAQYRLPLSIRMLYADWTKEQLSESGFEAGESLHTSD